MSELDVLDANGIRQKMSVTTDASGDFVGSTCLTDPGTGAKMQVGAQQSSDNQTLPGNSSLTSNVPLPFNGQTFDRQRNNVDAQTSIVVINGASAQTFNAQQTNYNHRGAQIGINVTQLSASTTVAVLIQGQDVASGQWYTLLTATTISAVGFQLLTVYPGVTPQSGLAVSQILPRTWRASVTIAGPGTASATVGVSHIV